MSALTPEILQRFSDIGIVNYVLIDTWELNTNGNPASKFSVYIPYQHETRTAEYNDSPYGRKPNAHIWNNIVSVLGDAIFIVF